MQQDRKIFKPAKKMVCFSYKNNAGISCETFEHANNIGSAKKRARAMNLMYPNCDAKAFLVPAVSKGENVYGSKKRR